MAINVRCTGCRKYWPIRDELSGQLIQCPSCNESLLVPTPDQGMPLSAREGDSLRRLFKYLFAFFLLGFACVALALLAGHEVNKAEASILARLEAIRAQRTTLPRETKAYVDNYVKANKGKITADEARRLAQMSNLANSQIEHLNQEEQDIVTSLRNEKFFLFDDRAPHLHRWLSIQRVVVLVFFSILLLQTLVRCVFLYRAWKVIQDGQTWISPGMAVFGLFIPVFNVFWEFVAIRSLGKRLNAFASRHGLMAPRASVTLLTLFCLLNLAFIPLFVFDVVIVAQLVQAGDQVVLVFRLALLLLVIVYGVLHLFAMNSLSLAAAGIADARFAALVRETPNATLAPAGEDKPGGNISTAYRETP